MIEVILTFIYVGAMAVGGGLVTIPLLLQTVVEYGWITKEKFYDIIALSEATPGPLGLNIATFVGYERGGILLAILASVSILIPSFILISIVSKFYEKYNNNKYVRKIFVGLRAATVGLIASAIFKLYETTLIKSSEEIKITFFNIIKYIDYKAALGMLLLLVVYYKFRGSAVKYILVGGILGVALYYFV